MAKKKAGNADAAAKKTKKKAKPTKPEVKTPSRKEQLETLRTEISQEYGVEIYNGDSIPDPTLYRRPTGLLSMDLEIGGGLPCGGMVTLSGPPGVGKTYLCWSVAAQNQFIREEESSILYAATEAHLAKDHARMAGFRVRASEEEIRAIDVAREQQGRPKLTAAEKDYFLEQIGVFHQLTAGSAEEMLGGLIHAIRSGLYDLIILDSISNLMPEAEEDGEIGAQHIVARSAKLKTEFSRKIPNALLRKTTYGEANRTCLIAVKQVAANMSTAKHKAAYKEKVEAWSLDHNRLIGVELKETDRYKLPGAAKSKYATTWIGKKISWYVSKGKSHCHDGATGSFDYYYETGVDMMSDLFLAAMKSGAIEAHGGGIYHIFDKAGNLVHKVKGKRQLIEDLRADPGMVQDLRFNALSKRGVECVYG